MSEKIQCEYCKAEIDTDAKKCKYCGEWVQQGNEDLPEELKHFNWGAFLLNWIWGIMHGKYITLLYFVACLIPIVGPLAISIWFGIEGNKWAWNSGTWKSVEEFNKKQRAWVKLWIILLVFSIILLLKFFIFLVLVSNIET
jgi:hypothetical protein